jgi:hypothetical protein
MKNLSALVLCLGCISAVSNLHAAADLKQSKVTQVVNDVQIISAADQSKKSATVNDDFNMPDILRTGPSSRAELVAPDQTVTRVGANTIFSFDPANRTINLKQGSLLFHSPHGKGGGTIHTGSATASVLGSTLIVTTTASGGFKVLALEDEAEIKFLNGLKQKLQPGQMTFVLPGGNQASPVIIFRLDDLVGNSQLVKGFSRDLPSLPLIQDQINKQLNDIRNGKLGDTGLQVGGDADAKGVQVIDLNTLQQILNQSYRNPEGFDAAISRDANIYQPSLDDASIPTPPHRVFVDAPFLLPDNVYFAGQPFIGFAAKNIFIYSVFDLPLAVDLSPYAALPDFDIVAARNLNISGNVSFIGLSESPSIYFTLVGGRQIRVAPETIIRADVANFEWQSPGELVLDSVNIFNAGGNTAFNIGDGVQINNSLIQTYANLTVRTGGAIRFDDSTLSANSILMNSANSTLEFNTSTASVFAFGVFNAQNDITLADSVLNADPDTGGFSVNSHSGSVNVSGTSVRASSFTLTAGDGIMLDGTGQFFSGGSGATANFTAANTVALNNADFTQYATMNISGHTVNLLNVKFDNVVRIFSDIGQWHNGFAPGYVNDLGGNTWRGNTLSAADGFSGTISGTGVTIGKR